MKEKQKQIKKSIILGTIGLLVNILLRWGVFCYPEHPFYLNFTGTIFAAYLAGPLVGGVVGLLTCVFGILICLLVTHTGLVMEAGFVIPMLLCAFFVGNMKKVKNAQGRFFQAVGIYVNTAMVRSFCMIFMNVFFLRGRLGIPLSDAVADYMRSIDASVIFEYVVPVLLVCFIDTFASMLALYIAINVYLLIHKKLSMRKYLRKNKASGLFTALLMGVLTFALVPLKAQAVSGQNFVQKLYNAENGLLGGAANDIDQTSDGVMWVGTYGGLYRFDGNTFTMMRDMPLARSIDELYVDDNDNLWISSNGTGLSVRTPEGEVYTLTEEEGLPSNTVKAVCGLADGSFYVGTVDSTAIVTFDESGLKVAGTIEDLDYMEDWECTADGYVIGLDNLGIVYVVKDGEVTDKVDLGDLIDGLCVDGNTIYLAGENANLYTAQVEDEKLSIRKTKHVDEVDTLFNVFISSEGTMYVSGNNCIGYFNDKGELSIINTGEFNNAIINIMEDYQSNIWFTSTRCGILELCASSFENLFDVCNVEGTVANTIQPWQGLYYVGTDTGLVVLDEDKETSVENFYTEYFAEKRIRCIYVDESDHLWLTTQADGIFEVVSEDEIYQYTTENGLPRDRSRNLTQLENGTILASTDTGLAYIKDHEVVKTITSDDGMGTAYALCLVQDEEGNIYAGTNGDGIFVVQDGKIKRYITQKDGLPSGVIMRIVKDEQGEGYFVLTGSGMCYMYPDESIREFDQFPYYNNTDLFQVGNNKVVVLSTAGIYIVDYDDLMSYGEMSYTHLDGKMGLPGSITSNAWNYLSDDELYFAGNTGIYKLNCLDYDIDVDTYRLDLSAYRIDMEESVTIQDNKIYVPAGCERLTLEFGIYNYTTTDPYVRYYMAGVDESKNTMLASELKEVTYFNPPSGSSTFYIEVLDANQTRVLDTYTYTVVKEMEEYEKSNFKLYFYGGLALITLSLVAWAIIVVASYNSRRQQAKYNETLQKLEREKAEALEKSLLQEEAANRSKSDFLANMSHEIRTPINAIIGMDTMILRESSQPEIREYAQSVYNASNTLLSLINDILDFSKIESGKMELVEGTYDLGKLIGELQIMMEPKAANKGLELKVEVDPKIPCDLYGDEIRIKQIILNILNNAVKYTNEGSVTLKVGFEQAGNGEIALKVCVSDTGIGIKEEDISKLFSPFERIEENRNKNIEGTGLGMSITKNLLALMNSHLEVSSIYGQGSDFAFTILQPVRSTDLMGDYRDHCMSDEDAKADHEYFHAPDARILVVDDVEMNLLVVRNLLKRIRIGIDTADSGRAAIEMCKEKTYDIIFLDSMMPQMNGEETLHHIKEECPENEATPVIMLTAHAIKGAREEYLEKGFDNYLSKPVDGRKLEAMIQNYLPDDKIILWDGTEEIITDEEEAAGLVSEEERERDSKILQSIAGISQIDLDKGIETAGGEDSYLVIARNFYDTAPSRINMLKDYYADRDVQNYTIQVHALKSTARLIGAYELSERAWELEQAGRATDWETIDAGTEKVIASYEELHREFDNVYGAGEDAGAADDRELMDEDELKSNLSDMRELLDAFDFETAKELFESLGDYKMPKDFEPVAAAIRAQLAEVNRDEVIRLIDEYLG